MKTCPVCGETKPLDGFYRNAITPDGRTCYCKECNRAKKRGWHERNRERVAAYSKRRRLENPSKTREWNRKNHAKHRQARNEASREWRRKNAGRVAEYNSVWAKQHPEYFVAQVARRRHALGPSTAQDLAFMAVLRGDPCSYCGEVAGTIDHIEPLNSGGSGRWGNLTASCRSCNPSKGAATLLTFLATRA